jgi:uncharacterized ferritin-like protein (DUF455 family)
MTADPKQTRVVRGIVLACDPAREDCFATAQLGSEPPESPAHTQAVQRERLHRHMSIELQTLEVAARTLVDFVEAPWELRLQIARQCWDEARHVSILYRRLREKGGRKGEFPIVNFDWAVSMMIDDLPGRLAVQNRTLEGGEMDLLRHLIKFWRDIGDEPTAEAMEAILADEVQHVRYANRWLRTLAREDARSILDVARAMSFLKTATEAVGLWRAAASSESGVGGPARGLVASPSAEDRRLAEFTETEIAAMSGEDGRGAGSPTVR